MKLVIYCFCIMSLLTIALTGSVLATDSKTNYGINFGQRVDDFKWNIAGDLSGQTPNILSELTWQHLNILQIEGFAKADLNQVLFLQGSFNYGFIQSGKNQDSDYLGDNRTDEFSRSNNSGNGGNVGDASLAVGYNVIANSSKFKLSPLFGYAFNWQNLHMSNGYQTVTIDPYTGLPGYTGPFSGLNSTYQASWGGPWLGVHVEDDINPRWMIYGNMEYHFTDYSGTGDWNLRDDLAHPASFGHSGNGAGFLWSTGAVFTPNRQWNVALKLNWIHWTVSDGTDQIFAANGGTDSTRLNEVDWNSRAIMLTITRKF